MGGISAALVYAAYPPPAGDLNPRLHLSNLIGKTAGTVCIIGDSTATAGPTAGNNVDPTQILWGFLQDKLIADNQQIPFAGWTFTNFAIGGSNEAQPIQTGTASGLILPSWFTVAGSTWLSYVQTAAPDVLFWVFGTNASTAGEASGSTASTYLRQALEVINGWTKVPNIIFVTTKSGNPATDSGSLDDLAESAHKAQAAFHRTFARSNAAGYSSFSALTALGFGLVDLGRDFTRRVEGFDPATQYFESRPAYLINGLAFGSAAVVGVNATTVAYSTHGDYRLTFVIPAGGGTTLFGYGGGNAIKISGSEFAANHLRLNIGGTGAIIPRYILDGAISGAPSQAGSSVNTSNAQDVTITVTMSGMRVQCTVNGTLALDIIAPRFISGATGGLPINITFATAPTGSPLLNITEFYDGIGAPTTPILNYTQAYGTVTTNGVQGGNSINHQTTRSAQLDNQYIKALDFRVPVPVTYSVARVVTAAGAVTVTAADFIVEVNKTVGAATPVNLPAGVLGMTFIIKDGKGDAGANNITITPAAGNIDNAGTKVISTNLGSARVTYDGTQWIIV